MQIHTHTHTYIYIYIYIEIWVVKVTGPEGVFIRAPRGVAQGCRRAVQGSRKGGLNIENRASNHIVPE